MKIVTIVGARPQFVKAAAVSRKLRKVATEILIHTGQHYDAKMSEIFFEELNIPKPDYNLNVGSGSHANQTAKMMIGIEEILLKEMPEAMLVYGDTNSTLAGALAAIKLQIPIIHVEAGLRSYNMKMPEEQNRILTDRISKYLFCPTQTSVDNLQKEGIKEGVYLVGDVMCDAVLHYMSNHSEASTENIILVNKRKIPNIKSWYLATIHRAENTENIIKLSEILDALNKLEEYVLFPMHPRIQGMVKELEKTNDYSNILWIEPVGYIQMLYLVQNAIKIITDSGGLQKEAYILNTPCVTVRNQTEWVETLSGNHNVLTKPYSADIIDKIQNTNIDTANHPDYYGNGNTADKICEIILNNLRS